jgi:adenosylcobinamide-GDP ribazoletransferase
MLQALRHFLLAVQFFTRVPVVGRVAQWVGYSPAMLRASSAHFPGVGWMVGLWAAAVFGAVSLALHPHPLAPLVAAVLSTVATVYMTGGFHEDGLADVVDGLGGCVDRERALDIMKDSRIGAYGAMALVLALLSKISLLALLGSTHAVMAITVLVAVHVFTRFWPLLIIRVLPHVGDTALSKSKPLADQITLPCLLAATVWVIPALAALWWLLGGVVTASTLLTSALAAVWMWRWFSKRLQGFTGDCLGSVQQVTEIAAYLGAAIAVMALTRAQGAAVHGAGELANGLVQPTLAWPKLPPLSFFTTWL